MGPAVAVMAAVVALAGMVASVGLEDVGVPRVRVEGVGALQPGGVELRFKRC